MKTALELLCMPNAVGPMMNTNRPWTTSEVELVAQRAREEMREMAASAMNGQMIEVDLPMRHLKEATNLLLEFSARIRALKVKP